MSKVSSSTSQKCFIAIEEELLLKLWIHDPSLVVPFARPFQPVGKQENSEMSNAEQEILDLLPPDMKPGSKTGS